MMKILLISDSHGSLSPDVIEYAKEADEVWHAGDLGCSVSELGLSPDLSFRGVYGNIDDHLVRRELPEFDFFQVAKISVLMIHIGGYPGRYNHKMKTLVQQNKPQLTISGHSHILKIMRDAKDGHLHMNPGACGHKGFHSKRTAIRFQINEEKISNVEVIEFGRRGRLNMT